jgi:uncharacterized protein with GYD domain
MAFVGAVYRDMGRYKPREHSQGDDRQVFWRFEVTVKASGIVRACDVEVKAFQGFKVVVYIRKYRP